MVAYDIVFSRLSVSGDVGTIGKQGGTSDERGLVEKEGTRPPLVASLALLSDRPHVPNDREPGTGYA